MTIPRDVIDRLIELPIEDVATKLGIDVYKHKARCFMHEDHNPSITFSKSKNLYRCWVCREGGGPIKLVQDKMGWNYQEACVWLADQFNIRWSGVNRMRKTIRRTVPRFYLPTVNEKTIYYDEEVYSWLIDNAKLSESAESFLFEERHFKKNVIDGLRIKSVSDSRITVDVLISHFGEERCLNSGIVKRGVYGLGFCFITPCLLFPYYEQAGRLVGIQSRYLGEKTNAPRFQFLSSQKTRVFNLPILNTLSKGDRLYISEGITDCLALLSAGLNAVALPSATILPLEDLILLKGYDLHMFPDQDEAGQKAFWELRRFFVNHYSNIKAEILPTGIKDYCDYYITTLKSDGNRKD